MTSPKPPTPPWFTHTVMAFVLLFTTALAVLLLRWLYLATS